LTFKADRFNVMDSPKLDPVHIFTAAVKQGCSDIHLKPGSPPKVRKDGLLIPIPGYEDIILDGHMSDTIIHNTMSSVDHATFANKEFDHDYAFDIIGLGRFRMNAYKTRGQTACVGRLLQDSPKT
jgi:twitching motility protein PilT